MHFLHAATFFTSHASIRATGLAHHKNAHVEVPERACTLPSKKYSNSNLGQVASRKWTMFVAFLGDKRQAISVVALHKTRSSAASIVTPLCSSFFNQCAKYYIVPRGMRRSSLHHFSAERPWDRQKLSLNYRQ